MPEPIESDVLLLRQQLAAEGELPLPNGTVGRTLCIYDHWLSVEEADTDIVSFAIFQTLQEYRFYLAEEDKFVQLFAHLFRSGTIFCSNLAASDELEPVAHWAQLIGQLTLGLREQGRVDFYVPRYRVLLHSAFDLNMAAYFLPPLHYTAFAELAAAYGLHLLE
ncbi:hypothetical protein [Solirubrum puertoriconensis]|uniref:Uncharacterized protein n=1 Tax=Solirubrum puertoriconensis TaxID=1751427 RepID=A0A9X0HLK8_SOLP1|nr:hypothetical protein [Solirubrum puertoriconensis]KUG08171.1 hypothetical protein ASU33_08230 [Solirubrum puertoriconensis]